MEAVGAMAGVGGGPPPRWSRSHIAAPRRYHRTADNRVPNEPAFIPYIYSTIRNRNSRKSRKSKSGRNGSSSSTGVRPVRSEERPVGKERRSRRTKKRRK